MSAIATVYIFGIATGMATTWYYGQAPENTKNNENSENNENVGDNENSGGGENDVNNIRKTKYVDKTPLPYLDDVKLFLANKLKKVDRTRDVKNTDNLLSTLKKRLENNRHYISNE